MFLIIISFRYRGKGVGTALVKSAIKWSKIRSYDKIECAVSENQNDARKVFMNVRYVMFNIYLVVNIRNICFMF